jgi:predicted DNA-binding WGR domain protein
MSPVARKTNKKAAGAAAKAVVTPKKKTVAMKRTIAGAKKTGAKNAKTTTTTAKKAAAKKTAAKKTAAKKTAAQKAGVAKKTGSSLPPASLPPASAPAGNFNKNSSTHSNTVPVLPDALAKIPGVTTANADNFSVCLPYDVDLNISDAGKNMHKFHKMQVIKDEGSNKFYFGCHWGRIGAKGQALVKGPFGNSQDAMKLLEAKYREKRGVSWENREMQSAQGDSS